MDPAAAPAGLDLYQLLYSIFGPILQEVIVGILMAFVIGPVIALGVRHNVIQRDAINLDTVNLAVHRGVGALMYKHGERLRSAMTFEVHDPAIEEAAKYLETQIPKKLKQMGIGPEQVRNLVVTELANRLGTETAPAPVTEADVLRRVADSLEQLVQLRKVKS